MKSPNLLKNMASLGGLQIANFALTLAILPYLTRTLGVETWGRVVFVQIVIGYLTWICNWGFYLNTTRKVAASREKPTVLADLYISTWVAQWVLTGAAGVVLVSLSYYVPLFSKDRTLYVAALCLLAGNALTPFWFLNGVERIRQVAIIQILTKLIAIPFFLILIKGSDDANAFIAINGICAILMGIVTATWIQKSFRFSYSLPRWKRIFSELKEGTRLFAASGWASLGGSLVPIVLGSVAGSTELGYYNLADRVKGAATTVLHPITAALFPRMCHLFATDSDSAEALLKRSAGFVLTASASISLIIFLFASEIIFILGGGDFSAATATLKWLAPTPFLITLSSFCTHQIIIPAQKSNVYHAATFAVLCLAVLAVFPFIQWGQSTGAAILVVILELVLAIITVGYLLKNRFLLKTATVNPGSTKA